MNKKNCFTKIKNHFVKRKLVYFFIFIFLIYNLNFRVLESADNTPARYIPLSLINEGNFDLNEYINLFSEKKEHLVGIKVIKPYYLFYHNEKYFSINSPISGLFNLPAVFIVNLFVTLSYGHWLIPFLAKFTSTILMVFAALFIFLTSRRLTSEKNSYILTIIFAFGSNIWSLASQDLWSHTSSIFFLSMSVYILVRSLKENSFIKYLGLSLSGAVFARSSNLLIAIVLFLYLLFYYKDHLKKFYIYALPIMSFFFAYNLFYKTGIYNWLYLILLTLLLNLFMFLIFLFSNRIVQKFKRKNVLIFVLSFLFLFFAFFMNFKVGNLYEAGGLFADMAYLVTMSGLWSYPFFKGLLGLLISPSRGLLIFSPVFIFSLIGIYKFFKSRKTKESKIYFYSLISLIILVFFYAKYSMWYGGWSYGYRMVIDIMPFLIILIIPSFKSLNKNKLLKSLFWCLMIISILIQLLGVLSYDYSWNLGLEYGCNIDECKERVWSVKDSQIIYHLKDFRINYFYSNLKTIVSNE